MNYSQTEVHPILRTYDATGATRDALGRVVQKTETLQGTSHVFGYTYDVQGRLTDVRRDGTLIEHYGYDLNGNRTTATVNGTTVNPIYDDQDRLLSYGGTTFTYTANGELRTKTDASGTTTYSYDAMGSLIAVNLPDGRLIEYVTDGRNRRVGKMVNGVMIRQWLYRDQLKPVAELDGAGNLVAEFIYGTKANVPDLVVRGGNIYRIVSDQLGSPVLAINTANSSDIPFQATYAAFGERTLVTGTGDWMPFGFAGGLYDADTGLTRFGARDYDAVTGRWTAKDPIRFGGGESNIYSYVGNGPVNSKDAFGLAVWLCERALGNETNPNATTRTGPDWDWNPLYHAYVCTGDYCGGLTSAGGKGAGPFFESSPGTIQHENRDPSTCQLSDTPQNSCMDNCVYEELNQPAPAYNLFNMQNGINCQEYASELLASCSAQCSN